MMAASFTGISTGMTYFAANRQRGGICSGTIACCVVNSQSATTIGGSKRLLSSIFRSTIDPCDVRNATPFYCILTGHILTCYETESSYHKGDTPLYIWYIVGASIWFPQMKSVASSKAAKVQQPSTSFRFVTNQGTQVYCWNSTEQDCTIWLSSIQTGLEYSLAHTDLTPNVMPVVPPLIPKQSTGPSAHKLPLRYCRVCGVMASSIGAVAGTTASILETTSASTTQSNSIYGANQYLVPLPQHGVEDRQGTPIRTSSGSTYDPTYFVCNGCCIAQGVVHYIQWIQTIYVADHMEQLVLAKAHTACHNLIKFPSSMNDPEVETTTTSNRIASDSEQEKEKANSEDKPNATQILQDFVQTKPFTDWTRQCGVLSDMAHDLIQGYIDGVEFLDLLDEMIGCVRSDKITASSLKQQAFRNCCANDMGTAMKLLVEQAVPSNNASLNSSNRIHLHYHYTSNSNNIEVFRDVLEFLLDLCGQDTTTSNLSSIAFFWPQLCHIHLRMLPATNAATLARVDLMEDFLITVATKYSIHLALELVWSHVADLEESLQVSSSSSLMETSTKESSTINVDPNTVSTTSHVSPACRRRRFAVLRFLCELESLLFDFEGGWGGGSITLGKMFTPTPHQVHLMKVAMTYIQEYRVNFLNDLHNGPSKDTHTGNTYGQPILLSRNRCLSRSARWHRLSGTSKASNVLSPSEQAQEKLRIAKNADYFSCHLIFSKRLADIAEKLRFMDVADRPAHLEHELNLLNASGTLGGDPLNRVRDHLIRVVRVPSTEGHVFRSKERTPVLLLMEIIDEITDCLASSSSLGASIAPVLFEPAESNGGESVSQVDDKEFSRFPSEDPPTEVSTAGQATSEVSKDRSNLLFQTNMEPNCSSVSDVADVPVAPLITTLEGALEGSRLSPGPKALKRFDGENEMSKTPNSTTPKDTVQKIVSNVAQEQLRDILLPNLDASNSIEERSHDASVVNVVHEVSEEGLKINANSGSDVGKHTSKTRNDIDEGLVRSSRRISALSAIAGANDRRGMDSTNTLAPTGDIRRAVLTTIMMRGLQGNTIAAGTANSVQLSLKELERKRATELLLSDDDDDQEKSFGAASGSNGDTEINRTKQKLFALGLTSSLDEAELASRPTEEDEALEAIRLMLIQNQVAQGRLSTADAAKVLQHSSLSPINASDKRSVPFDGVGRLDASEHPTIDAGDVDSRLVGCGPLPPAVLQALTLWKGGMVTHAELLELVKKDIEFVKHSILVDADNLNMLQENSAFWGRFAFGERWAEKKSRIGSSSPQGSIPGWDMMGVIVKSNDDLRQEAFIMQLIELCQEAFELAGLELWISPYRILATGRTTGVIECVRNAMSFDALKKRPGYGKGGLREHLQRMTEFTADPGGSFKSAQQNFVRSLAAYSLLSYLFLFKDRHNGNLLLDTAGHVIHIDFGFVFGIAPGGSFSLEMSTPFKLTEEMLDVMGGLRSPLFSEFVTLFCCGYLALQAHCDTFLTLVEITCRDSTFKCFDGRDTEDIVAKLRERFNPDLSKEDTVSFALDLIKQATTSYGTRQYDIYQYLSQGIY